MRLLHSLLLLSLLALAAGCSAPAPGVYVAASPASAPAAGRPALRVATRLDAVAISRNILDAEGWRWIEPPAAVFVEQMTYQAAHQYLPQLGNDPGLSPELPVWLVVHKGRWRLMPYGQTQGPPAPTVYAGCNFLLLTAQDGSVMAAGDAVCPPQP